MTKFHAGNAFRVTWSERVHHRNALTEIAWEDAVQGLGMTMSTVASEKTGNVVYRQGVSLQTVRTRSEFSTFLKTSKSREQFLLRLTCFYPIYG